MHTRAICQARGRRLNWAEEEKEKATAKKKAVKKPVAKAAAKPANKKVAAAKKEETKAAGTASDLGLDDEDDTKEAPTPGSTSFNGADEEDVIDRIFLSHAVEAKNAVGETTGEKVVFKEDAQKAGKEIIETLKGIKGPQLAEYMKDHFEEIWANYDVNNDGEISLEESHTF